MSKPSLSLNTIQSTLKSWDADLNDNFDMIQDFLSNAPFPPAEFANEGALPTASNFDGCIAIATSTATGKKTLFISNGTTWKEVVLL